MSSAGLAATSSVTGGVAGVLVFSLVFALALAFSLLALAFSLLVFLLAANSSFICSCFVRFLPSASSASPTSVACSGERNCFFLRPPTIPSVRESVCTCSSTSSTVAGLSFLPTRSSPSATFNGVSDSIPSVRYPFLNLPYGFLPLYVSALPDIRCMNISSAALVCFPVLLFTACSRITLEPLTVSPNFHAL